MRRLDIAEQELVAGGLFAGDAAFARIYYINGPNDSAGSDTRSNNGGGSATVQNKDGSSTTVNCPSGTVPSIVTGGVNLNAAATLLTRGASGNSAVGGSGTLVTCKDKR